MWDTISRAELDASKELLRAQRQLQAIEQDQAGIEAFDQLIEAMAEKFKIGRPGSTELDDGEGLLANQNIEGVSFLITQAQKSRLRELGIGDDQIRNMNPKEAHRILGIAS